MLHAGMGVENVFPAGADKLRVMPAASSVHASRGGGAVHAVRAEAKRSTPAADDEWAGGG